MTNNKIILTLVISLILLYLVYWYVSKSAIYNRTTNKLPFGVAIGNPLQGSTIGNRPVETTDGLQSRD